MKRKKNWIKGAIKRPGAFREWCKKRGFPGATAECIQAGKRSKNPRIRREALLAEKLKKFSKRKRKKRRA